MLPGQEIHLDHADRGGPHDYRGYSHKRCNLAASNQGGPLKDFLNVVRTAPVPTTVHLPKDPGPHPDWYACDPSYPCYCQDVALRFGSWPSQCWNHPRGGLIAVVGSAG